MASFNPSTAYLNDWQHYDFIEDAELEPAPHSNGVRAAGLKVRRDDLASDDFAGIGTTTAINERSTGFVVWETTDAFDATPNGLLRLEDGSGFIIKGSRRSRFGPWVVIADEERVDAV